MELTVVIVNFNSDKNKLNNCLKSISIKTKILIIDHSHNLTLDKILIPENLKIEIIRNENLGNGAGINCGLKNSQTRFVLYLDSDVILSRDFFKVLELSANKINEFAILAPKIKGHYSKNSLKRGHLLFYQYYYNKFFNNLKVKKSGIENINEVFYVNGSIMFIDKKNTFDAGIKFDEKIFLFFEENDFFHQCFKSNKKIYMIENLPSDHLDGSVDDKSFKFECFKKWHWEWSKYYFMNKHYNSVFVAFVATKNLIKFIIKMIFFFPLNRNKYKIYLSRINGLLSFYLDKEKLKLNEL